MSLAGTVGRPKHGFNISPERISGRSSDVAYNMSWTGRRYEDRQDLEVRLHGYFQSECRRGRIPRSLACRPSCSRGARRISVSRATPGEAPGLKRRQQQESERYQHSDAKDEDPADCAANSFGARIALWQLADVNGRRDIGRDMPEVA
jgi:hypothetical protein